MEEKFFKKISPTRTQLFKELYSLLQTVIRLLVQKITNKYNNENTYSQTLPASTAPMKYDPGNSKHCNRHWPDYLLSV